MAPKSDENSYLALQCFEFCKALASQKKSFTFSLTVDTFVFSLDTKDTSGIPNPIPAPTVRFRKKTPSEIRRNRKRRLEFLRRKQESVSANIPTSVFDIPSSVNPRGESTNTKTCNDSLNQIERSLNGESTSPTTTLTTADEWRTVTTPPLYRRNSASSKSDTDTEITPWAVRKKVKSKKCPPDPQGVLCQNCNELMFSQNHVCTVADDDDDDENDDDDDCHANCTEQDCVFDYGDIRRQACNVTSSYS